MISINLTKAKEITHAARRAARAAEFEPYDAIIMKQIPGSDAAAAEAERQKIREKYAAIQVDIDSAPGAPELKLIIEGLQS
jgi:hypothetical protein